MSVSYIVNFLSEKRDKGLQSKNVNSLRSAISGFHDRVDGMSVQKHKKFTL